MVNNDSCMHNSQKVCPQIVVHDVTINSKQMLQLRSFLSFINSNNLTSLFIFRFYLFDFKKFYFISL